MASIMDIEGIGEKFAEKLRAAGIRTTEALLEKAGTAKGRKELAAQTGIDESKLLDWVNRADLYRIRGIGSEYSDLLEAAGVDTVKELAQRDPNNLYEKLVSVNQAKNLVNKLPGRDQVADWIKQAKELPRAVEH